MNEFFLDYQNKNVTEMKISHSVSFFYSEKINDAQTYTESCSASCALSLCCTKPLCVFKQRFSSCLSVVLFLTANKRIGNDTVYRLLVFVIQTYYAANI